MKAEAKPIKILKIEDGKGYFYSFNAMMHMEIDKIDRDALFLLTEYIINNTTIEMDNYVDESINNNAQKIVYKNIYEKLSELFCNRNVIITEIENKYQTVIDKYK